MTPYGLIAPACIRTTGEGSKSIRGKRVSRTGLHQAHFDLAGWANPKPEARNSKQIRNPKSEHWRSPITPAWPRRFGFRPSDFGLSLGQGVVALTRKNRRAPTFATVTLP